MWKIKIERGKTQEEWQVQHWRAWEGGGEDYMQKYVSNVGVKGGYVCIGDKRNWNIQFIKKNIILPENLKLKISPFCENELQYFLLRHEERSF